MRNDPFRGYDQWKTASPYDDEFDAIEEYAVKCEKCGSEHLEVVGSDADILELDVECSDCSHTFIFNIPEDIANREEYEPLDDSKVFFREMIHPSEYEG